jgi:outer membrane protein assembly factor BamB
MRRFSNLGEVSTEVSMFRLERLVHSAIPIFALTVASTAIAAEANWPKWRGPRGDGHATESGLPTKWQASSVEWKSPLKGWGQSSPVIWGERMFLTTALEKGKERVVFCLSTRDGKSLWQHTAWTGDPEKSHDMNGWASATCVTDGEVVVAFFGKGGLHAYTVEGKHLWSRDLGVFESPWGTAACPIIYGNLIIQNGDSDKDAFIEAFDKQTGKTQWRVPRPDHRGWSTPILRKSHGRDELVLNGHEGVIAYEPLSGKQLWFTPNSMGRGEPTVTPGNDMLFVVCGLSGDMYALRTDKSPSEPKVAWSAPRRSGRDLPSPIVIGDYVLVSSMSGICTCYEAKSGKELWKERLEGKFSASPIAIEGLALFLNEAGETVVIKPGPKLEIVSRNKLNTPPEELFRASITPLGGKIYLRSDKFVYCVGKGEAKSE